jgi:hypothetical protein
LRPRWWERFDDRVGLGRRMDDDALVALITEKLESVARETPS